MQSRQIGLGIESGAPAAAALIDFGLVHASHPVIDQISHINAAAIGMGVIHRSPGSF
jgi:hypothetical protein